MKKTNIIINKLSLFVLVLGIVILLIGTTLATAPMSSTTGTNKAIPVVNPPTWWEKLIHLFSIQMFTIVGQDNHADVYPRCVQVSGFTSVCSGNTAYVTVPAGTTFQSLTTSTRSLCGGKSGLWNIYAVQGGTLYKRWENIDATEWTCSSTNDECRAELYCMPYIYPPTESSCDTWGATIGYSSGQVSLATKTETDPYMPLKDLSGNTISTYTYCNVLCTGDPITCWQPQSEGICTSRTYDCSYGTYPNCPSGYYTTKSECESHLCVPSCTGKVCGDNGCGGSCGTCQSGYTCSNGQCVSGADCSTYSGTSGRCDSYTITDKKCIGTHVYICSDYGTAGKCWTDMADCSLSNKTCSGGQCISGGCADVGQDCVSTSCCSRLTCDSNKICTGGGGGNRGVMTWSKFYSVSNDEFKSVDYSCRQTSDCSLKDGYTVTCKIDDTITKSIFEAARADCDKALGWWDDIINFCLHWGSLGIIPKELICGTIYADAYTGFKGLFVGNGMCMAESTTWYGQIWESALKTIGSFGIPRQYVLMASFFILFLVGILLFQLLQGAMR